MEKSDRIEESHRARISGISGEEVPTILAKIIEKTRETPLTIIGKAVDPQASASHPIVAATLRKTQRRRRR